VAHECAFCSEFSSVSLLGVEHCWLVDSIQVMPRCHAVLLFFAAALLLLQMVRQLLAARHFSIEDKSS
jgi:hypothetical protein